MLAERPPHIIKPIRNRYHIGESLLPSIRPYLNFIGAEELVASQGYTYKVCYFIIDG